MRIHPDSKTIHLNIEEVKKLCRPGAGADTCIWLVAGADGFSCIYYNRGAKSLTGENLEERWRNGLTVAKRDGCDEVQNYKRAVDLATGRR